MIIFSVVKNPEEIPPERTALIIDPLRNCRGKNFIDRWHGLYARLLDICIGGGGILGWYLRRRQRSRGRMLLRVWEGLICSLRLLMWRGLLLWGWSRWGVYHSLCCCLSTPCIWDHSPVNILLFSLVGQDALAVRLWYGGSSKDVQGSFQLLWFIHGRLEQAHEGWSTLLVRFPLGIGWSSCVLYFCSVVLAFCVKGFPT